MDPLLLLILAVGVPAAMGFGWWISKKDAEDDF